MSYMKYQVAMSMPSLDESEAKRRANLLIDTLTTTYTFVLPEGHKPKTMIYDSSNDTRLKCKCWRCDKEIPVEQHWDFMLSTNIVIMRCHGSTETKNFTDKQIETINKSGYWWAFL